LTIGNINFVISENWSFNPLTILLAKCSQIRFYIGSGEFVCAPPLAGNTNGSLVSFLLTGISLQVCC